MPALFPWGASKFREVTILLWSGIREHVVLSVICPCWHLSKHPSCHLILELQSTEIIRSHFLSPSFLLNFPQVWLFLVANLVSLSDANETLSLSGCGTQSFCEVLPAQSAWIHSTAAPSSGSRFFQGFHPERKHKSPLLLHSTDVLGSSHSFHHWSSAHTGSVKSGGRTCSRYPLMSTTPNFSSVIFSVPPQEH